MATSGRRTSGRRTSGRRRTTGAATPGGARLRAIREQLGRAQLWVEAEADLGTGYLQRVESGRVAQPSRVTVERILGALDARYSERREVLELFGYSVRTPLPTEDDFAWARASCHHELHDVPFPAYILDCVPRLIAWNRYMPKLLGAGPGREDGEVVLSHHLGRPLSPLWFDLNGPFGRLVTEPDLFIPALVRTLRYEWSRFPPEPWMAETLAEVTAQAPRFRAAWEQASAQPPPISAARVLLPVKLLTPGVGLLQFRLVSEPFVRDTRFRLIYFVPADAVTLRQCAAWASS